jgi:hypothetical protein
MKKYSKQFFCVSNTDGSPSTPNNFQINFSNSSVTNIQSNHDATRTYFTPQLFTCDWFFNNVSEEIKNNKFVVSQPGVQVQVVAINPAPFAAAFQQSANSAVYAFAGVVAPTVSVTLSAPALAGAGQAFVTCHNQATNALLATSSTEFVGTALAQVDFTFSSLVSFPAAVGIYFRVNVIGAFASYNYGVDATPILAMTYTAGPGVVITIPTNVYDGPALNTAVNAAMAGQVFNVAGANMVFANVFNAVTSKYTWVFAPGSTGITTISFVNTIGDVQYDSAKVFGSITDSIAIPIAQTNYTMLGNVDLVPFQVIRIHSNCAKRTFQKSALITSGANANATSILQGTDILFEVPIYSAQIGSVITWTPITTELYRQDLVSNFDQFNISLRDKRGNLIPLLPNCEVNLTFMIERELILPNPDNVKNAIADYAQFSTL